VRYSVRGGEILGHEGNGCPPPVVLEELCAGMSAPLGRALVTRLVGVRTAGEGVVKGIHGKNGVTLMKSSRVVT
jgi:hypothetical protein